MIKKQKILVMGATGMLGWIVYHYFKNNSHYDVWGTIRNNKKLSTFHDNIKLFLFDATQNEAYKNLESILSNDFDYVINCIGLIKPYCIGSYKNIFDAIKLNSTLPNSITEIIEKKALHTRIIQIATDCVYDGKKGNYSELDLHNPEDVYGKTKSLGEINHAKFLNIRASIIGYELSGNTSLLGWFLSNKDNETVSGFTNHFWNGITTLQFSELCQQIIDKGNFDEIRKINHVIHYVPNESIAKNDLLVLFNSVFNRNIIIQPKNYLPSIDRTLISNYWNLDKESLEIAIFKMKEYLIDHKIINQ